MLPKLDNSSALFHGSQNCICCVCYVYLYLLERLQKVQSSAARQIFKCRKQTHISPLLMSLHWLPINDRIEYKLSVICHFFYLGLSPIYLSDILSVYTLKRNLRSSSDNGILCILGYEQRHLGIAHFLELPPQYGILCLQDSDILILSRNLCQH